MHKISVIVHKLYNLCNKEDGKCLVFSKICTTFAPILFLINMVNGVYTILLLIMSNVFMTFAWYGHLRLQQSGVSTNWPLYLVIAFSWMIAFFEYCCQVPANRIGFIDNGGPFNLVQLKVIQECISLVVFAVVANFIFQHEQLHWNHAAAALCLVAAVYFVFMKP
jgi:uncharacterized protein (DUF486 family)